MLSVSVRKVQRWEEPNSISPSIVQMMCIAHRLYVSVDYLLGFTDQMRPAPKPDATAAKGAVRPESKKPQPGGPDAHPARREPPQRVLPDASAARAIPASLLRKLCQLQPDELEMAEAYITRLINERNDDYILF